MAKMLLRLRPQCLLSNVVCARGKSAVCLPETVQEFVDESVELCQPSEVHVCDGSRVERQWLIEKLVCSGGLKIVSKYRNSYLIRSDPKDVARTEGATFLVTCKKRCAIPEPAPGCKGQLGNWMSIHDSRELIASRFKGAMKGRTMYVVPFLMGPYGSSMCRAGVELTDSAYVALSMGIMTRMGKKTLKYLEQDDKFVKGLHCCGQPKSPNPAYPWWPCDPKRVVILHMMDTNEIFSYGSGYGGNSLLGKKCFALRFGSSMAKNEGWLAEHMLILGIKPECGSGTKRYFAAAFPSACGKTNLAMLTPAIKGYKVTCVGDDIAWIHFNQETGRFHAINPESGLFGVAPGTSRKTNPVAMDTIQENTLFTNVAETSDGGVWWEGKEKPSDDVTITDWLGKPWKPNGKPAAHPNSRFTTPAKQVSTIDEKFEDPEGVPISAFIFGGRRPKGVPLVYEALNWKHGVLVGAGMKSEATTAAEHKRGTLMHDPFAMRPFFGLNFGHYLQHWLDMGKLEGLKTTRVFHVNWFLLNDEGKFAWPGFGENIRVLEWIYKRVEGYCKGLRKLPFGYVPDKSGISFEGMKTQPNYDDLFKYDEEFWKEEAELLHKYFCQQLPKDLPQDVSEELKALKIRIEEGCS